MFLKSVVANVRLAILFGAMLMLVSVACNGIEIGERDTPVPPTASPIPPTPTPIPLTATPIPPPVTPIQPTCLLVELSILIEPVDAGSVEIAGSVQLTDGDATPVCIDDLIRLIARPRDAGWRFDHWENDLSGIHAAEDLKTDTDKSIRAVFVKVDTTNGPPQSFYRLTMFGEDVENSAIRVDDGTIRLSPTPGSGVKQYAEGTIVVLSPVPDPHYRFDRWDQACSGTGLCELTMNGDKDVEAFFKLVMVDLSTGATPSNGGAVSPAGTTEHEFGSKVPVTYTPNEGFEFKGWRGACSGTGSCLVTMDGPQSVDAQFERRHLTLTVVAKPTEGGRVSPAGTRKYPYGASVPLTAEAAGGFVFRGWDGDCSGIGPCTVTMDGDKSVVGRFSNVEKYRLSTGVRPQGAGTLSGGGTYLIGDRVTVDFNQDGTQAQRFRFTEWSGACSGTGSCSVVMDGNKSVTANFTHRYTLTTTPSPADGGSVAGGGTYDAGNQVTVTATPNSGWSFNGWNGACSGTGSCLVTMDGSKSVTANFTRRYTLTTTPIPADGGSVAGGGTYDANEQVTVTDTPNSGWSFSGWSGACSGTGSCLVTMDGNKNVTANFIKKYTLTTTPIPADGGSVAGGGTYDADNQVTVTATPNSGWSFSGGSGACSGTGPCLVTMDGNKNVTANFTQRYTLTTTPIPADGGSVAGGGTYDANEQVTVTDTPNSGWSFTGWSGACSGTGSCLVTMDGNKTVTANFTLMLPSVTKVEDTDDGVCDSDCSFREAIAASPAGFNLTVPAGTYTLSLGQLIISQDLTLTGAGSGSTIIQVASSQASASHRVLQIASGTVSIAGVTIRHGNSFGNLNHGGGILVVGGSSLSLTDVSVVNNTANYGGGIYNMGMLNLLLTTVNNNTAAGDFGGGIVNDGGTVTLTGSTVSGNTAPVNAGGVWNIGVVFTIVDSVISNNTAGSNAFGGGIDNSGTLTLTGTTVSGNSAGSKGGGVHNRSGATLTISRSTLSGNNANAGGGIYNGGAITAINSTLSGNSATNGGGIRNVDGTTLSLTNVTIVSNTAGGHGGGLDVFNSIPTLVNTLLANNTGNNCFTESGGSISSQGHNLSDDANCSFSANGDKDGISANLGPLQDNGGLTFTHALLTGSPAIGAGDDNAAPATDQRGTSRTQDSPSDIGAYEAVGVAGSPGGKIAFISNRDGNFDVYVMEPDGSNQTRLTNNSGDNYRPAWSPDGSKIAFDSDRDGNSEIYVMNADGSNQVRLTSNLGGDWSPSWSADGSKIAFDTDRDGNREIYVMNVDGSGQTNVTNTGASDLRPDWSPDGAKIAYSSWNGSYYDIYTMSSDGTNNTQLTSGADSDTANWSPSGSMLAFTGQAAGKDHIFVMNSDGSNRSQLTSDSSTGDPSWSSDGAHISYHSNRDGNQEIYVMNSNGTGQIRLTNNPGFDMHADWSP